MQSDNSRWRWMAREANSLYGAYWLRRGLFTPDQIPELMQESHAYAALRELSPASLIEMIAGDLPDDDFLAVGQMESPVTCVTSFCATAIGPAWITVSNCGHRW